ncbi:hypothetical protein Droror1_Dr00017733, partial [Drosera rotundifolia]
MEGTAARLWLWRRRGSGGGRERRGSRGGGRDLNKAERAWEKERAGREKPGRC